MSGIYKIKNLINGKTYIGSTISKFNSRWNCHKSTLRRNVHKNRYLQSSWNKYGENHFKFEIVETIVNPNREILIQREKYFKDLFKSEYNIAPIDRPFGTINLGRKHTPETIEKMKISHKNHKMPIWFGEYISNIQKGKLHSEETKIKISKNCKGKNKGIPKQPFTKEHLKNLSLSHIGKNSGINHYMVKYRYKFYNFIHGEEILAQCELNKKYNLKPGKISLVCNGKRKSYKGWICKGKYND
jgi:group I intron endonuclease